MAANLELVIAERKNKTIYRDGDRCIKLFHEGFSKADILNEALNQARVEDIGLHVPKILEVTLVEGKWAIISEFIEGKTLEQLMKEDPNDEKHYLDRFVEIQCAVLDKTCPLLNDLKIKMTRKISQADIDATTRYELHTRLHGMPQEKHVCHGDFNPSNILITKAGEPYILDWSHVTQGNAEADAARTYLLFCLAQNKTLADKYLDTFCANTEIKKRSIQKWMPIVAASQSVKGHEDEREFLLSWANVVEYQ